MWKESQERNNRIWEQRVGYQKGKGGRPGGWGDGWLAQWIYTRPLKHENPDHCLNPQHTYTCCVEMENPPIILALGKWIKLTPALEASWLASLAQLASSAFN